MPCGTRTIAKPLGLILKMTSYKTEIVGKDINSEVIISAIVFFIPITLVFAVFFWWFVFLIPVILSVIVVEYFASTFSISIGDNHIEIGKSILGLRIRRMEFAFKSTRRIEGGGGVVFNNESNQLTFHFERKHHDTVEYEINSKIHSIGSEGEFGKIVRSLNEYVERKNTNPNKT